MNTHNTQFPLESIQEALRESGLHGWLFYDFRGLDPISRKILGIDPAKMGSRRWFYHVPAVGEPAKLVHAIETAMLDGVPGRSVVYLSWQSLQDGLADILGLSGGAGEGGAGKGGAGKGGAKAVSMQYSPKNEVPYVSRVDAGTVELVRSLGVEVVSSADLVQRFHASLSPEQIESHRRAGVILRSLVDEVFSKVAQSVKSGSRISERSLLDFVEKRLDEQGLVYDHPAIVGVNAHAADPHFEVPDSGSSPIRKGDLLLFDVWAKEPQDGAIYADITWTAFVGDRVPEEIDSVFRVVRDARNAAIAKAREAFRSGRPIQGYELDRACRDVIDRAGFGKYFIHRTGHSIHEEVHGNGACLDDLETHDTRLLLPNTVFSVEPGVYFPGKFGVRTEVDVLHTGSDAEVTGPPHQEELRALLA